MKSRGIIYGTFGLLVLLASLGFLVYSCSGSGGNGAGNTSSTGTMALYATDDLSNYQQVVATVNLVQLVNTGTGATCDLLTTPTTIDIANLSNMLQLLSVASCQPASYNRVHIEFARSVDLMDGAGNSTTCEFTSYKDKSNQTNALQCGADTCSLDISGAVNVVANQSDKLALDFRLKDFEMESSGTSTCTVTMKVSPISGKDMEKLGRSEGITGLVSDVTPSTKTFTLTKGSHTYSVLYSGISSTAQPGLDDLLLRAAQDELRTRVTTTSLDPSGTAINASSVLVKVEGTVSALDTGNHTFTLTYKSGTAMTVDYSNADVEGALEDNAWVQAKLYGYKGTGPMFLAAKIEVEFDSSVPDGQRYTVNTED